MASRNQIGGNAPPAWDDNSQRNIDDRQLDSFGAEFAHMDMQAPDARAKLEELAKRVEAYHQALFTRNYNAMDILKDTEALQKRIRMQRKELRKAEKEHKKAASEEAPAPQPVIPVAPAAEMPVAPPLPPATQPAGPVPTPPPVQ